MNSISSDRAWSLRLSKNLLDPNLISHLVLSIENSVVNEFSICSAWNWIELVMSLIVRSAVIAYLLFRIDSVDVISRVASGWFSVSKKSALLR